MKHADPTLPDIFVLQIGYRRNKNGWKLTQIEDKFALFQSAQKFWGDANPDSKLRQKDYPPELSLAPSARQSAIAHGTTASTVVKPPKPKRKPRKPAKGTKVGKQHK